MPANRVPIIAAQDTPESIQLEKVRADAFNHRYGTMFDRMAIPDRGRYNGMTIRDVARLDSTRSSPFKVLMEECCSSVYSERRFQFFMKNPEFCWLTIRVRLANLDDHMAGRGFSSAQTVRLRHTCRMIEKRENIRP